MLDALKDVLADLWDTIVRSRNGLLAMILCFLPVGAAAATGLFAAIAGRWNTSGDAVALYTGVLGGVVAAVGCLAGGWLSDQMDRKRAYAVAGAFLAVMAMAMAVGPHNQAGYAVFTLAYQFGFGPRLWRLHRVRARSDRPWRRGHEVQRPRLAVEHSDLIYD